jgi:glycine cleavage system H protein
MPEYYETSVDKFFFKVRKDYLYSPYDAWVRLEDDLATVGVTDLLQRKLGDIAFVESPDVGTAIEQDDQMGTLESAKATVDLTCPVTGEVVEVNVDLETAPERVNESPYEDGWLFRVRLTNWDEDRTALLTPEAYFELLKKKAQEALQTLKGL